MRNIRYNARGKREIRIEGRWFEVLSDPKERSDLGSTRGRRYAPAARMRTVPVTPELHDTIEKALVVEGKPVVNSLKDPMVNIRDFRTEEEKFDDKYCIAKPTTIFGRVYEDATLGQYEPITFPVMGGGGGFSGGPSISLDGEEDPE